MRISHLAGKRHALLRALLTTLLLTCASVSSTSADEWHFNNVQRIVAVSDVHGAYDAMVSTFQAAGIIDEKLTWNGAKTHLVITGDLLDRGSQSRRVVDLIMRLEKEAARAGGQVHMLLGNHEVMNLIGDTRYISDGEYAAFSKDESADEREYWYQHFRRSQTGAADDETVRALFDKAAPPGFFGHRRAFRIDGVYAKWLLEKPLMIVINETAYVHGGLPEFVAGKGLDGVNGTLKKDLFNYMTALATLEDAGVLNPIDLFRDRKQILTAQLNARSLDHALAATAKIVIDLEDSPLHEPGGPLWYRGSSTCNELVEGDLLDAALRRIGAARAVIGHTTTVSRKVQQRLSGRVIEINTGMLKSSYAGTGYALIIEEELLSVASENGEAGLSPIAPPRRVGDRPDMIDDVKVADILSHGDIADVSAKVAKRKLVRVTSDGTTVFAYFDLLPREKRFVPELAAYRLDRMLGLDMVPVTVRRTIAGQRGTLQLASTEGITEYKRVANRKRRGAPCSFEKQLGMMHVYDVLTNNTARTPHSMLYSHDGSQLVLVYHTDSFGTGKSSAVEREISDIVIGNEWRKALLALNDRELDENLSDVLGKRHLVALAKRRDILISKSNR